MVTYRGDSRLYRPDMSPYRDDRAGLGELGAGCEADAVATGTSSLYVAVAALDLPKGSEVLVSPITDPGSLAAIVLNGLKARLMDSKPGSYNVGPEQFAERLTSNVSAVMVVHAAGQAAEIDTIVEIAQARGIKVIEDCAQAHGALLRAKRVGTFGDIAAFSFDPVKVVTSIDGGCVVVRDPAELERLRRLRLLGVDRDTTERYKNRRAWDYDVVSDGFRYHLTNILASVGISQIKRADEFITSRQAVCRRYNAAFGDLEGVTVPASDFSGISPFIYSLRVLGGRRRALIDHLRGRQVDVGIHFVPVHQHTFFKDARRGDMKVTDRVVEQVVTLPLHSCMREDFVERVIDGVTGFHHSDPGRFADAAVSLLTDDNLWRRHHEAAVCHQQGIAWSEYAALFEGALLGS